MTADVVPIDEARWVVLEAETLGGPGPTITRAVCKRCGRSSDPLPRILRLAASAAMDFYAEHRQCRPWRGGDAA